MCVRNSLISMKPDEGDKDASIDFCDLICFTGARHIEFCCTTVFGGLHDLSE